MFGIDIALPETSRFLWPALDQLGVGVLLLERSPAGARSGQAGLRITDSNPAFRRLTGHTGAQLHGQPFTVLECPESRLQATASLEKAAADGSRLRARMLCAAEGGRRIWLGISFAPTGAESGHPDHFIVLVDDESEQQRRLEEESAIQALLAQVFVTVDAAVAIVDAKGRTLLANPCMERLLRAPRGMLVGRSAMDFVAKVSHETATEARTRQLADRQTYTIDIRMAGYDAVEFDAKLTAVFVERADLERFRIITLHRAPDAPRFLIAGKVRMIGLAEVRTALGERWPALAERVMLSAEHVIRKRIGDHDSFSRTADQNFLICFGESDEQSATFRAAMIGREIRVRLIGQGEEQAVAQVRTASARIELPDGDPPDPETLNETLNKRLTGRIAEIEELARAQIREALRTIAHEATMICTREQSVPMACQVGLPRVVQEQVFSALSALPPAEADSVDLDALTLGFAREQAMQDAIANQKRLILVQVGVDTLSHRARAEQYLERCRQLDPRIRKRMIMMITGMPADLSRQLLADCNRLLRPLCRGIGYDIGDFDRPTADLLESAPMAMSFDASRWTDGMRGCEPQVRKLVAGLRSNRVRLLAYGLADWKEAERLRGWGLSLFGIKEPPRARGN